MAPLKHTERTSLAVAVPRIHDRKVMAPLNHLGHEYYKYYNHKQMSYEDALHNTRRDKNGSVYI